ncbi:MAG: ABC transporter permease [Pirellula sp.]|nr:ABC transporter permease [Pirellula sp.]
MPLSRLSLREMQQRPVRTLLTLLSILIGAGAIVATAVSSRSAQRAQMAMVEAVTGRASLEITAAAGAPMDAKGLTFLGDLPNIETISPLIRRFSMMTVKNKENDPNGKSSGSRKFRVQLVGANLRQDQKVRGTRVIQGAEFESLNETEPSDQPTSVWVDSGFADAAGVAVGDDVKLLTKSGVQTVRIAGFTESKDASSAIQSAVVIAPLRIVQRWTRSQGKVDVVQLVVEDENLVPEVQSAVEAQLPEGVYVRVPTLRSQVANESTTAIQLGLLIATIFSLILATFIIFNTFQMNVGERRRQLGILRALGTTRRQILWMILREAFLLGCIGSVLGCVAGYYGASILNQSTSALLQIDIPESSLTWVPIVVALFCGVSVSLLGAAIPAFMATYASPADAMKPISSQPMHLSLWFWFAGGVTMFLLGGVIQYIAALEIIPIRSGTAGIVIMIVGVVLMLPASLPALTSLAATPLMPWFPIETKLARKQILRNPGRSSMTIGILLVAMAMGLGMASTILDNIRDVQSWYRRSIVGDFFIRAAMPDMSSGHAADMPDDFPTRVEQVAGVSMVDTLRFVSARSGENSVIVVVRKFNSDTNDFFDLIDGQEEDVTRGVQAGEVVIGSVLSERTQLRRGDSIELETKEGKETLKIAGVTNEYLAGGLTVYMEANMAKTLLNVEGTDAVIVKAKPSDFKQVEAQLKQLAESEGLMLQSYAEMVQLIEGMINNVVGGLWTVLALGSLIAAFGLINTLAMNILEQTREIGMLRVIAMTRSQIRRMILAQAFIMSIIGILPGLLMGLGIASVINLTTMIVTGHLVRYHFYPWLIVSAVVIELLVVFLAAFLPAERAARLNLATALQYE